MECGSEQLVDDFWAAVHLDPSWHAHVYNTNNEDGTTEHAAQDDSIASDARRHASRIARKASQRFAGGRRIKLRIDTNRIASTRHRCFEYFSEEGSPTPVATAEGTPGLTATSLRWSRCSSGDLTPRASETPTSDNLTPLSPPSPDTPNTFGIPARLDRENRGWNQPCPDWPSTSMATSEQGDVQIVESQVHVNVIEDGKRSGIWGIPLDLHILRIPEKLEIPGLSTFAGPTYTFDMQSPSTVDGPAGCAEELDALSRMTWERQLSNMVAPSWY